MAKQKAQKTTRDTSFNFSEDTATKTITTLSNYTATKAFQNIELYDATNGMSVSGAKIIAHAKDNRTLADLGYKVYLDETDWGDIANSGSTYYYVYGAPFKSVLNNRQHYNNCGVESTLNTLATAGIIKMKENLSDQKSVENKFLKQIWNLNLCQDDGVIGKLDKADGGTQLDDYREIFENFGISSKSYYFTTKSDENKFQNLNELAYRISQGCGAVIGLCSKLLWKDEKSETGKLAIDHAVAIVGVVYDTKDIDPVDDGEGNITYKTPKGFYIHDTGAWMTRYICLDKFKEVTLYNYQGEDPNDKLTYLDNLRGFDSETREYVYKEKGGGIFVTITDETIKDDIFNLNATGDKNANKLTGNGGDNVIKGLAGDDLLYGNAGDDEIRGGAGNDVIVGNNTHDYDKALFKELIDKTGTSTTDFAKSMIKKINDISSEAKEIEGRNVLYGDAGNDIVIGGDQADLIYGGAGNDYIYSGDGRNAVYGGKGDDIIIGGFDNDRLFGDAGNDYIYGLSDDDTIHGGAGKDHIWGGRGDDRIETGKDNDTVYIEGREHGIDTITAEGGATTIKFIDETYKIEDETYVLSKHSEISNMYFSFERQEQNKKLMDLGIAYTKDEKKQTDGVKFSNFYNNKTNSIKSLNIVIGEGNTSETYKVSATNKKTANLSSTTNNILFTTYAGSSSGGGTTITTSDKNDIVTMVETEDMYNRDSDNNKIFDTITYTKGNDRYVSEERNTYYKLTEFTNDTMLSIYDNVDALEKVVSNEHGMPIIIDGKVVKEKVVSTDDRLYVNTEKGNLHFLFDVRVDDKARDNLGLYILNDKGKYVDVATGDDVSGFIYMDSFFSDEEDKFFGNGQIEHLLYEQDTPYENFSTDLVSIYNDVVDWLEAYNESAEVDLNSAFDALGKLEGAQLTEFIGLYDPNANA